MSDQINSNSTTEPKWLYVIESKTKWWDIKFLEVWRYKDLIFLFIKRDFTTFYKQTILGPLWYFIQPLLTTTLFTLIFTYIARLSTDEIPPHLFYLSGLIPWTYFAGSLLKTSSTFIENVSIFGKVYFPRIIVPISVVLINLFQFGIQMIIFLGFYLYSYLGENSNFSPTIWLLYFPLGIVQLLLLGLGFGILVSSFTTKYRDLLFLIQFSIQLWMYLSPVVFPASLVPIKYLNIYMMNPIAPIIESFRFGFFGRGVFMPEFLIQSWIITIFILLLGILSFHRIEKSFMDTI